MFTPAQVRQYQDVYKRWFWADKHAVPRTYSRDVLISAECMGFIKRNERGTIRVNPVSYLNGFDLPVEVLWAFVKPEIEKSEGFSITKSRMWLDLNFDRGDVNSIEQALFKLDRAGYIDFLSSGNVWRIYIKDEHK